MEEKNIIKAMNSKMLNSGNIFANRIDEVNEENNSELIIESNSQNQIANSVPQGKNTKLSSDTITISVEIDEDRNEILKINKGVNLEKIISEFC